MIRILRTVRIADTNKVVQILSGATCLSRVLVFQEERMIPNMEVINLNEAKELTGTEFKKDKP